MRMGKVSLSKRGWGGAISTMKRSARVINDFSKVSPLPARVPASSQISFCRSLSAATSQLGLGTRSRTLLDRVLNCHQHSETGHQISQ